MAGEGGKQNSRIEEVIGDYYLFVTDLLNKLVFGCFDVKDYPIDHLCYRVKTQQEYEVMKAKLTGFSQKYAETEFHNRPISKFVLTHPLHVGKYMIPLIELPSPRPNVEEITGLEHFEMVVGDKFEEFVQEYKDKWTGYDNSGPFNQTCYTKFENGHTVKFHKRSLYEVVNMEQGIFKDITR